MTPRIAIVILNWNGKEIMEQFLPSVTACSPEAEVIVADNGSSDGSVAMLKEKFPQVGIIELQKNYGFAEGYNQAIAQITLPYVLLLNSDVRVTPHWLTPLLQYMDGHPEVAACQPKIKDEKDHEKFEYAGAAGGFIDFLGYPFCRGRIMENVEKDTGQYNSVLPVFWITGAAMMIRTATFKQVGGLDGRFFAHMEEIDLCWRMRSRGLRLVCIPQSEVYHVGGATLAKSNPRKTFLNFRNNLLMIYKNAQPRHLGKILAWRKFLDYLAFLHILITGNRADAFAIYHARKEFHKLLPLFEEARKENLSKTTVRDIPEMLPSSILWKYYVKRIRTYSSLFS